MRPTLLALLAAAHPAAAQVNVVVVNPGFEATTLPNPAAGQPDNFVFAAGNGVPLAPIPGWTFGLAQTTNSSAYAGVSDLGVFNHSVEGGLDNNIVWLYLEPNRPAVSAFAVQQLAVGLAANTLYTLTVRVAQAARTEGIPTQVNPVFPTLGDGVTTGDVFARLRVGTTATPMPGFVGGTVSAPADNEWVTWTLTWQTGSAEPLAGVPLVVELVNRSAGTGGLPVEVFFDDVAVTATPVPEPAVVVASAAVGAALAACRTRRVHPSRRAGGVSPPSAAALE